MHWLRFSLRSLLAGVAFVALACTVLLHASALWASLLLTATLLFLLVAVLGGLLLRGPPRAFCIGYAVFGWGYLLFVYWPPVDHSTGKTSQLATTRLLNWTFDNCLPSADPSEDVYVIVDRGDDDIGIRAEMRRNVRRVDFIGVGQSLWQVVVALAGGLLGRSFAARQSKAGA